MSTQFVKSPPTNPDSELWKIGTKWRKSQKTGIDYTELDNIMTKHTDIDIEALLEGLNDQLTGRQKQSISYVGHLLVASYTQDGKVFVYGYPPEKSMEADKKASFNTGMVPEGQFKTTGSAQLRQQQTFPVTQQSNTSVPSTVQTTKPTFSKKTIDVPFHMIALAIDDEEGIAKAISERLYPLPVIHVGTDNFNYISEETGKRTFLYGRLRTVEIDSEITPQ